MSGHHFPNAEPVRPNRDRPLRTASGPISGDVPVPRCLAGLLTDDGERRDAT